MPRKQKYSNDDLRKIALKYKTRSEFSDNESGPSSQARRRGIFDEICSHMTSHIFSKDDIFRAAKKYLSRTDFASKDPYKYSAARRMKILDDVCKHMQIKKKYKIDEEKKKEKIK